jgi:hypothetical protein
MSSLRTSLAQLLSAVRESGDAELLTSCEPLRPLIRGGFIDLDQTWKHLHALIRADVDGVLASALEDSTAVVVRELLGRGDTAGIDAVAADLEGVGMTLGGWRGGCAAWVEEALAPEAVFEACQSVVALFPMQVDAFPSLLSRYVVGGRNAYADLLSRPQPLSCRRLLVAVLFSMGATHHDWTRWLEWLPAEVRGATSGVMADVLWSLSSDSNFEIGTALPAPPEIAVAGWTAPVLQARTA